MKETKKGAFLWNNV